MEPVVGFEPTTDGLQNRNRHFSETRRNPSKPASLLGQTSVERSALAARQNVIAAGFVSESVGKKAARPTPEP